jgi:hypothetical protein
MLPVLVLLAAWPARANDSTGFLGTGGLELRRAPGIALESEDLRISPTAIEVDYVFRNRGAAPVTTLVVFPLPDIDLRLHPEEANWDIPDQQSANFLDFTVTVNGQAVAPAVEQKALVGSRDVTELVQRYGLGAAGGYRSGEAVADDIEKLPPAARAALRAGGATARRFGRDWPAWRLQTRFYWEQTFPPDAPLAVAHRYRPFAGRAMLSGPAFPADRGMARLAGSTAAGQPATRRYCVDRPTATAAAALGRRFPGQPLSATEIEYILTTARNWGGPIGRFRLSLEMGRPDAVLSLCWRGALRREGPTRFTFEATNWLPDQEIRLAIIAPAQ